MFTTRMVRLFAVVLDHDTDRVTRELLGLGVMQFIDITEIKKESHDRLNDVSPAVPAGKIAETRKRIEGFLHSIGTHLEVPDGIDLEKREAVDIDEVSRSLDRLSDELESVRQGQRTVQQEVMKLEDISRQVETYGGGFTDTAIQEQYSFISIRMGSLPTTRYKQFVEEMKDIPSVILPASQKEELEHLLLIFMKRDAQRVEKILENLDWTDERIGEKFSSLKPNIRGDLKERIRVLEIRKIELAQKAQQLVETQRESLENMWIRLRVNELFSRIQSFFKRSSRTVIFSGWLPASKQSSVADGIVRATGGSCYLEWLHPGKEREVPTRGANAPVELRNPSFMKPFQMLVTNYGVPEYGTIDPTFFVMFSYLVMFGLMFGDVGQGAVLVLAGIAGMFSFGQKREGLRNLSKLMVWCGASSMIAGALFGSYFGTAWLKPLWFDFHGIISGHPHKTSYVKSIYDVLKITVYFGIGIIGIGLLFNWVNLLLKQRWSELILDKRGLLGGWFYFGGIYIARFMVLHDYRSLPAPDALFYLVGMPALLLFAKGPVHFFSQRKQGPRKFTVMTPMDFAMEWIVELLELFSGYLSNTLSFMRVAGLGIAHVTLMMSFFELARMASGGGLMNPWSIMILVFGNILVIGLEGLTAGIQALRLNYYEFFSKFFRGSGEVYSPVSLKSRE